MTIEADHFREIVASGTDRERARAVRDLCVCHGSWELFRELLPELRTLAESDPSERVRREARHVLMDPRVENVHEDRRVLRVEREVARAERRAHHRALVEERSIRRARRRRP